MADQAAEGRLSPFLRRQRLRAAQRFLRGDVLDVGCGSGALAELVRAGEYVGVERDADSLAVARETYPEHSFQAELPEDGRRFDTVIALAVIEHVPDPSEFLGMLAGHLSDGDAQVVVTTPHPAMDWVHHRGASLGLFSQHANDEHEDLLDRRALAAAGEKAGLRLVDYRRFLFGANQIAAFRR